MQHSKRTSMWRSWLLGLSLFVPMAVHAATFAKGADVSWVDQEEKAGYKFYNSSGVATDPFVLLKNLGVNAIRLRVWVNPADGWNNGSDVLYKAKRAAAQGQRIMIDFHYSDTWADPSHQAKPAAWVGHNFTQLEADVYAHTHDTLNYLKTNGISVDWVQVGNEITAGMLLPDGAASNSNFPQLAGLINNGYNAVKSVYPSAQVIVHLDKGQNNSTYRWFFDGIKAAGAKWDVVGMSFYPPASGWASYTSSLASNMSDMVSRYGKPVMICEIGMDWTQPTVAKSMITDVFSKVQALGSNGLGVFYWEPEAYPGWQGYTMGATDNNGKFTAAMDPF